nr:hypothetical protein Iba_chr09eCG6160 [Ipomoea batatas]
MTAAAALAGAADGAFWFGVAVGNRSDLSEDVADQGGYWEASRVQESSSAERSSRSRQSETAVARRKSPKTLANLATAEATSFTASNVDLTDPTNSVAGTLKHSDGMKPNSPAPPPELPEPNKHNRIPTNNTTVVPEAAILHFWFPKKPELVRFPAPVRNSAPLRLRKPVLVSNSSSNWGNQSLLLSPINFRLWV